VFLLDGRGWGHGVGMSQWGAEGFARHRFGYQQILAHYYRHTTLETVQPRPVRVLLLRNRVGIRIGSAAPFLVVDARGRKLHLPARSVVIDRRFRVAHQHLHPPLRFRPGAQPLQVEFAGYRGEVVVERGADGRLMAVNELPLDRYLRGVVPREVPTGWHRATYEAQAVAARSYTLATLHPGKNFDLFSDSRSQAYGGVRAERSQTNLAIGSTAGQVLTWRGKVVPGFYFSTSGGRTSSVHDAWPRARQVPYLVSVADPYDYLSPHHVWPTTVLTADRIGTVLGLSGVRDAVVVHNSSGRASAVRVLAVGGWRRFPGLLVRTKFDLGSTDFDLRAMTLDDLPALMLYGSRVGVHGWLRGLGRARLQELTTGGWITAAHVRPSPSGRFALSIRATRSTELRLAYNGVAGDANVLLVTPRLTLRADGSRVSARVAPLLPLQLQRLTRKVWTTVATISAGAFDRRLVPGSYRVRVLGGTAFASPVSRAVGVHAGIVGA
jgi:stage II sporulation protein D